MPLIAVRDRQPPRRHGHDLPRRDRRPGIRWLRDEAAARAEMSDGTTLFRATIAASDVLGHFTGGGIDEVLVGPNQFISVEPVEPSGGAHPRRRW